MTMKLKVDEDSNVPEIGPAETRSEIKLPQGLFQNKVVKKSFDGRRGTSLPQIGVK